MSEITIDTEALGEKIVRVLKTIYDPEIPVDIYELGLIYDVFVKPKQPLSDLKETAPEPKATFLGFWQFSLINKRKAQQFNIFPTLTQNFSQQAKFALGLHPLFIQKHAQQDLDKLYSALKNRPANCVAVGEIGLEKGIATLTTPKLWQKQQDFFIQQIAIANQFNLPVSMHSRKSHSELLAYVKE